MSDAFSPFARLDGLAIRQPDAPAVIYERRVLTFSEFVDRVARLAGWLVANGLEPEQPAVITVADEVDHLVTAMALFALACNQMNLPPHETGPNRLALARKVAAKQIVADRVEDWMSGFRVLLPPFASMPLTIPALARFPELPIDATPLYQNTSGTTRIPRTIAIPLRRVITMAGRYADDPWQKRILRGSTMAFDSTRFHRICLVLAGNTSVFLPKLEPESLQEIAERAEVTGIHLGAYGLAALTAAAPRSGAPLPSFTAISTGGSRVPGQLRRKVRSLLTPNLRVLYSTSEIGAISQAMPEEHEAFPEGVGRPYYNAVIEIVDANGNPVEPGTIGEARVTKLGAPQQYVGDSEASFSTFKAGAFHPGDLLSRRDGEPIIHHGRADDTIILNGLNILPAAIENRLEEHPDVREAIVFGVKSRVHGEIPVAAVVSEGKQDAAALIAYCRDALGIRSPRQIVFVDEIPRSAVGKALRRDLAEAFETRRAPAGPGGQAVEPRSSRRSE